MEYNTVLNLNSIIYQIYNIKDFQAMKKDTLSSLKALIPCVCASILMNYSNDIPVFSDPTVVPENFISLEDRYIDIQKEDGSLWVMNRKQTTVFKDTELMSDSERLNSTYFKTCLKPFGLYYSVDMTISDGRRTLGILTLYRTKEQGDFTGEEVVILKLLSDHINARFSNEAKAREGSEGAAAAGHGKVIDTFISDYGLTAREAEILGLVFDGASNEEISEQICISPHTLKKHLQNLYRKTGVSGRMQLKTLT